MGPSGPLILSVRQADKIAKTLKLSKTFWKTDCEHGIPT